MKKQYTKKQICEAIKYWKNILEAKMTRQEYDDLQDKLKTGIVEFEFYKKDGTLRKAVGTLNPSLMPSSSEIRSQYDKDHADAVANGEDLAKHPSYNDLISKLESRVAYMPYFWDLENNGYRQFHVSRFNGIHSFKPTNNRNDVKRIGSNLFMYSDGKDLAQFLTPAKVEDINDDIAASFSSYTPPSGNVQRQNVRFEYADSKPTLIYNVTTQLPIDDFDASNPVKFYINEIRNFIFKEYNVKIEVVKVMSTILYK